MDRWYGKVAIVTGASSGMGCAIAEGLVRSGMQVVGIARRVEKIQAKCAELCVQNLPGKLHALKCDMTKEEEIRNAFAHITANMGPVHVLINAAGGNPGTDFIDGDAEKWRLCFDTNVLGLAVASREAVRIMLDNGVDGHIVNFNSILGHVHAYMPTMSLYSASKHAVTNLTELMRQELKCNAKKNNIKVTSMSPGAVRTEFINDDTREALGAATKGMCFLESGDVADAVMYVLGTPPRVHINEMVVMPPHTNCD